MAQPMNNGNEPSTSSVATIRPHNATAIGFVQAVRSEAPTAATSPTSRSSNSGKETMLRQSASAAK